MAYIKHIVLIGVMLFFNFPTTAKSKEKGRVIPEYFRKDIKFVHRLMSKSKKVKIYLLGVESNKDVDSKKLFPIKPYDTFHIINKEKELVGERLELLIKYWLKLANYKDFKRMMCHFPVYGLRFFGADDKVVFQTSICWMCSNYYLTIDGEHKWAKLPRSNLKNSEFKKLLDSLFEKK